MDIIEIEKKISYYNGYMITRVVEYIGTCKHSNKHYHKLRYFIKLDIKENDILTPITKVITYNNYLNTLRVSEKTNFDIVEYIIKDIRSDCFFCVNCTQNYCNSCEFTDTNICSF